MKILSQRSSINIMLFIALIVLSVTSILAYIRTHQLIEANAKVVHTYKVIDKAEQAIFLISEIESKASLYLLTKKSSNIDDITYLINQLYEVMDQLKLMTKDNAYQQSNLALFMKLIKDKLNLMYKIVNSNSSRGKNIILSDEDNNKRYEIKEQISVIGTAIISHESLLLEKRNTNSIETAKRSNYMLIIVGVLSEALFLLSIVLLNYHLYQKDKLEKKQRKTELELSERNKKLRVVQKRYDLAVQGSNTGLWDWKVGSDRVHYTNKFRKLLGYNTKEFPNLFSSFENSLHPEDYDKVFNRLQNHLREGKPYKVEYRLKNKNGEYRWYQVVGKATRDKNGNPVRMSGSLVDITDRKYVEMMKNEFVSIVSHELRTPLTSIHGAISLLVSTEVTHMSEEARQLLNIAKTNSERLIRLINDILDIEKIESGRMQFTLTNIDLNNLLKEAIAINMAYANKFSVKLVLSDNMPQAYVKADHDRLIQVMTNLISNAIKFSPKDGSVVLDMAIEDDNKVRVSVADEGEGIPNKFQSIIFQKFSQADSSTTRKHEGTGLGLNITKNIIEKLGGTINFNTSKNGTTFYFDLPMVELENTGNAYTVIMYMKNKNITDLLNNLFKQNNLTVKNVEAIQEIEKVIKQEKIDAIILDLSDIDSASLIKKIRSQPEYNAIPIAVVATKDNETHKELIMNAINVIDWIDESTDKNRLLQAIILLKKNIRMNSVNVLHVEDDTDLAKVVKSVLADHAKILNVQTLKEAQYELLNNEYDLAILDLKLPDGFSSELLPILNKKSIPVIVFSAYELPNEYISHVNKILTKSKASNEELLETIKKIIKNSIKEKEKNEIT